MIDASDRRAQIEVTLRSQLELRKGVRKYIAMLQGMCEKSPKSKALLEPRIEVLRKLEDGHTEQVDYLIELYLSTFLSVRVSEEWYAGDTVIPLLEQFEKILEEE